MRDTTQVCFPLLVLPCSSIQCYPLPVRFWNCYTLHYSAQHYDSLRCHGFLPVQYSDLRFIPLLFHSMLCRAILPIQCCVLRGATWLCHPILELLCCYLHCHGAPCYPMRYRCVTAYTIQPLLNYRRLPDAIDREFLFWIPLMQVAIRRHRFRNRRQSSTSSTFPS